MVDSLTCLRREPQLIKESYQNILWPSLQNVNFFQCWSLNQNLHGCRHEELFLGPLIFFFSLPVCLYAYNMVFLSHGMVSVWFQPGVTIMYTLFILLSFRLSILMSCVYIRIWPGFSSSLEILETVIRIMMGMSLISWLLCDRAIFAIIYLQIYEHGKLYIKCFLQFLLLQSSIFHCRDILLSYLFIVKLLLMGYFT